MSEGRPPKAAVLTAPRSAPRVDTWPLQKPEPLRLRCLWVMCPMERGAVEETPGEEFPGSRHGRHPGFGVITSVPLRLKGEWTCTCSKATLVPLQSQVGRWACDPSGRGGPAFLGGSSQLGSRLP